MANATHPGSNVSALTPWFAVLVASLGYFVDVFDIWLFANFRVSSLKDLGLSSDAVTNQGAWLLTCQQSGLLIGGFLWGSLGDKRGRASVMFASILTYSLANIGNAFVTEVWAYALLRFIAGFGLAGEIGTGITLVSELLPKDKRGYGVTIVATIGVAGAVGAALVGSYFSWRTGYIVGGLLGLGVLGLRILVHESGLFAQSFNRTDVHKGSFRLLFASRERAFRFIRIILVGVPLYMVFGLYAPFSPELTKSLGFEAALVPIALLYTSIGLTVGDLVSGLLSQRLKSRKKPIGWFLLAGLIAIVALHIGMVNSLSGYYIFLAILGFLVGYWICLLATSSEQFGTNLRSTVTTTVPNLVRGSAIPITYAFIFLKGYTDAAHATLIIATIVYATAYIALYYMRESFSQDLDFYET